MASTKQRTAKKTTKRPASGGATRAPKTRSGAAEETGKMSGAMAAGDSPATRTEKRKVKGAKDGRPTRGATKVGNAGAKGASRRGGNRQAKRSASKKVSTR
jgi:hypothetical protein